MNQPLAKLALYTLWYLLIPLGVGIGLYALVLPASEALRSSCRLTPQTPKQFTQCLHKLHFDLVPYHPDYAKSYFQNGSTTFIPLSGIPNSTTLLCREGQNWQSFESDAFGFSNPSSVWREAKLEAVLLGDSFLIGECHPLQERFSTQIQNRYSKVLNLGYPNSGPLTELARYLEYGVKRHPKRVFLFYYELNDASELLDEADHPILSQYLMNENFTQNLEQKSSIIAQNLRPWLLHSLEKQKQPLDIALLFENLWRNLFLNGARATNHQKAIRPDPDPVVPLLQKIYDRYLKLTAASNIAMTVFYLPSKLGDFRFYYEDFKNIVQSRGMEFVDMGEIFEAAKLDPYSNYEPYHYNSAANRLIAEQVNLRLERN